MAGIQFLSSYRKHAWLILSSLWAIHVILSARDFFPALQDACVGCLPGGVTPVQTSTGLTWSQLASSYPRISTYLGSILVDEGSRASVLGFSEWSCPTQVIARELDGPGYLSWLN